MFGTWVKYIGVGMMIGSPIPWATSFFFLKPGVSRFDIRLRAAFMEPSGLFQPFGWKLMLASRYLAVLGFVLVGVSIYL